MDQRKRSIPSVIIVYTATPACETTLDPIEGEILSFQVLESYNIGVDSEAKD
jgi:hypothetical protein